MSIIKADPVRDHVGWVKEAHDIVEKSDTVTAHKTIAQEAEEHAREHQQTREAANAAVKQIQSDWVKLLEELETLKESLSGANEALEFVRQKSELEKAQYFNWVNATSNLQYLDGAKNIVALLSAVPILEDRVGYKEELLRAHVKKMGAFGKEHGLEPKILKQLSGAVG